MDLRSGLPFWLVKNGLPYSYPQLDHAIETDVVILGGGISGALMGYHLINAGIDCVTIDSRTIGLGSTCASTALLQYEIDVSLTKLTQKIGQTNAAKAYLTGLDSIDLLEKICADLGYNEFQLKRSLYYAAYKKDIPFLKNEYAARRQIGIELDYLDQKSIEEQFGFSSPGALYSKKAAEMNPYMLTHALHQNNLKKGGHIYDRSPITKMVHGKNKVTLVSEGGYKVKASKVIYCTGYEVVEIVDKKIVDLESTYAVVSEQISQQGEFWKDNAVMWSTAKPYMYLRATHDKRIIIGGRDEPNHNPQKRENLLGPKTKQLVKDFHRLLPHIPFKPEFSWAGTFGSTKDGLPFIGPYKKLPGSYFALGFGGNGITFSVIAAKMITEMITGKAGKDSIIFGFDRLEK
jgi:glycine/D-amino acid oxidase-like deaminating enzyme